MLGPKRQNVKHWLNTKCAYFFHTDFSLCVSLSYLVRNFHLMPLKISRLCSEYILIHIINIFYTQTLFIPVRGAQVNKKCTTIKMNPKKMWLCFKHHSPAGCHSTDKREKSDCGKCAEREREKRKHHLDKGYSLCGLESCPSTPWTGTVPLKHASCFPLEPDSRKHQSLNSHYSETLPASTASCTSTIHWCDVSRFLLSRTGHISSCDCVHSYFKGGKWRLNQPNHVFVCASVVAW